MRSVVVTGLGVVAPTGHGVQEVWETALAGRSCVDKISLFDASKFPVQIAAEVRGFDAERFMGAKEARRSSRFVQFACYAVKQALEHSGLDLSIDAERCGCFIGVGIGGIGEIEDGALIVRDRGPGRIPPSLLPYAIPNMGAGFASILSALKGPNLCIASACASGTHAIGEAFLHVGVGTADVMVAGGSEAAISPLCLASFAKMGALSTQNDQPRTASRPFDHERDGFVMGEGSGVLVLEEREHARRRGAPILAEIVGYGLSADAHHITMPSPEGHGLARCISSALKCGTVPIDQVGYINAHGTSTPLNDTLESAAIETVFGESARKISVSSTKGVTGHCLGAAGGIEAIYTVLALHHGVIPPTANYSRPDPSCRLDYTPNHPRERSLKYALSNSCGFGGQNACLAFRHFG